MKRALAAAAVALFLPLTALAQGTGWEGVDRILGRPGKDLPGGVRRYGWPRTDLQVHIGDVAVEPLLALGSWAAFQRMAGEEDSMTMGDLVLLGPEVNPVARELQAKGFEILAIHNHLLNESPRIIYLHFHGRGEAAALAAALKTALGRTKTPLSPPAGKPASRLTPAEERTLQAFQDALGRQGTMAESVLQFGIPRGDPIRESGMEIPPAMGMATAINVEAVGDRVAATGDFVLVADEVNPVVRALHAHDIDVTALHSHMLRESPRLFFLHFWGVGRPEGIGAGLKDALSKTATR